MQKKLVLLVITAVAASALAGTGSALAAPAATDPGLKVFASSGCAACHTLAAAKATGKVGPNLDKAKPSAALVTQRVTKGKGMMPSFKGRLGTAQITAVASFVAKNAGKKT